MAKILVKKHSLSQSRLIKIRKQLDFYREEISLLDEKYEQLTQKELDKFVLRANRTLAASAFKACNKEEYIGALLDEKLQKYDVKHYMSHRRIKHLASKQIFARVRKGAGFDDVLASEKKQLASFYAKRDKYVSTLEGKRARFLAKYSSSVSGEFEMDRARLNDEYLEKGKEVKLKYSEKLNAEKSKIEGKIATLQAKIDAIKAKSPSSITLPDDVLLRVRGLKMYFGGLKAVDDLDFDVKKGEIFGLIGPNGAGKTTVFNCITRFYDATGGDMYFENKYGEVVDLRNFKVHDIILQGIGRTFQNIELVKEVSVIENLLVASTRSYRTGLFGHIFSVGALKKEEKLLRAKAMRILKFMGLENYAQWYAMGLPYGILKKVEIARALMADAKLIIMDEPAAGLNDSETAELTETIRKIRDEFGVTILLVEHDMSLVMNVCDTVCAISFGQMLGIGTTEEIQKNKAVQEAYLGVAEEE